MSEEDVDVRGPRARSGVSRRCDGESEACRDRQCFGCHSVKKDGAGPSFQKIAKAWKGRKDAPAMLVKTIRQGSTATGGPHWNKATMPDQSERPRVSDAEAKRLVRWILKQ